MISKETLNELMSYLDQIDQSFEKILEKPLSKEQKVLANILTVNEEWWELSDEVKRTLGLAFNKEKNNNSSQENLEEEFVDTLIPLLLLMKSLWIKDLDDAIKRKILKNNKRWY